MSGILDNKTRVLDTVLTNEGRNQLANGLIDLSYYSFTDGTAFYEADAVSGSTDASKRIYLEAYQVPQDTITVISDDLGTINDFVTSLGTINNTGIKTIVISGSNDNIISDDQTISQLNLLQSSSIEAIKNQQMIGSFNDLFETDQFDVDFDNITFTIDDFLPLSADKNQQSANINSLDGIYNDKHFNHVMNLRYLPPVTKNSSGSLDKFENRPPLPGFTVLSSSMKFDEVDGGAYRLASSINNSRTITFDPTSLDNNLFCQVFESFDVIDDVGVKNVSVSKLLTIDAGVQAIDDSYKHVFYVGKLLIDDKGVETFNKIFTLLFE